MAMIRGKTFRVKVCDRLTGDEMELSINQGPLVPTQEAAEVRVATGHTPFQNTHPGFEVDPEDEAKFKKLLQAWVDENPERAVEWAERTELPEEEANVLREKLKLAQKEATEAAREGDTNRKVSKALQA